MNRTGYTNRLARRLGILGVLLVLSSVPASPPVARAQEATAASFGGYETTASGTGIRLAPTLPSLLPVEVPFEGTVSLAFTSLASGGQGFGRASVLWPGSLIVGLRPLLAVGAGAPLPIPDYPIVIESTEHDDAKQNTQPGITMATNAKPERATATSDIGGFIIPALLDVGSIRTVSTSVLEAARVISTSVTYLNGVDILAGAVHIDQIKSTAIATSDSVTATCEGGVTISGASANGVPIAIDDKGIQAQGQTVLPGVDLNQAVLDLLANTGLALRALGGNDVCSGASANRTTSGLLLTLPLPTAGPLPPGGKLDLTLGATSATASANAPFDLVTDIPTDTVPSLGDFVAPVFESFGDAIVPPSTGPGPATTTATPEIAAPPTTPIDYTFEGVPIALGIGLVLLAFPASRPIRRYVEYLIKMSNAS